MSPITALGSAQGQISDAGAVVSKADGLVNGLSNVPDPGGPSFFDQLRPASFREIKFFVLSGSSRFGRRSATHEYPFRDVPWIEDLGRQSRRIQVTGYIVGNDVIAQRERLIKVAEEPGDGELVHPTLGRVRVSLMDFSTAEHWEEGRKFEVSFTFMEQGQRLFPDTAVSSVDAIANASADANAAAADRFNTALAKLTVIGAVATQIAVTASTWVSNAQNQVNSGTSLMNIATSLQGNFGRLLGQASGISFSNTPSGVTSLQTLIGSGAAARASVASAAANLMASAGAIGPASYTSFTGVAAAFAQAVKSASFTPADELRSMQAMATLSGVLGPAQSATADLFRRIAVCQLGQSSGDYQPSTVEEAAFIRTQALAGIDAEITLAGNQGDDGVYAALRILRAEVIRDMNAKGAQLPTLVTVTTNSPVPSLVLAQRLYRDAGRDDELARRANPVHPAFMPLSFMALST